MSGPRCCRLTDIQPSEWQASVCKLNRSDVEGNDDDGGGSIAEKEQNLGDHGYARRQPKSEAEEAEGGGAQRQDVERACAQCQQYKAQLEQQQLHTARLQKEVGQAVCPAPSQATPF